MVPDLMVHSAFFYEIGDERNNRYHQANYANDECHLDAPQEGQFPERQKNRRNDWPANQREGQKDDGDRNRDHYNGHKNNRFFAIIVINFELSFGYRLHNLLVPIISISINDLHRFQG